MGANLTYLEFDDHWQATQQGRFQVWRDMRDLLVIYHPFDTSATGDFGAVRRRVRVPQTWEPPFTLSFYCTDDYLSDETEKPTSGSTHDAFPGHRFKQVLVDGAVVWESDVADADGYGNRDLIRVDLTPHVRAGQPFELSLRVLDRVGAETGLDSDFIFLSWQNPGGPGEVAVEYPFRLRNYVYWGDLCLADRSGQRDVTGPRARPSTQQVHAVHAQRWPLPPYGEPLPDVAELTLETPAHLPPAGFPATCGVPLPAGRVWQADEVTLRNADGETAPVQATVLNRWRDGSVRWLLLSFEATEGRPGSRCWSLQLSAPESAPSVPSPVRAWREGDAVHLNSGTIAVTLGRSAAALVDEVRAADGRVMATGIGAYLSAAVEGDPQAIDATVDEVRITESGPLRAGVEERGMLAGEGLTVGRFVFRLYAYAGKPYVRAFLRIFNDTGQDLQVRDFGLTVPLHLGPNRRAAWGPGPDQSGAVTVGGVRLEQPTDSTYTVAFPDGTVTGDRSCGWMSLGDGVTTALVAVRNFWQQYPKALACSAEGLTVDLSYPTDERPLYILHDGEAKRHELLLGFLTDDANAVAADELVEAFQSPPRLMDRRWFCHSGGFGYAHWRDSRNFAELAQIRGPAPESIGPYGLRDFGDAPYGNPDAGPGTWRNNYYECMQGLLSEYLMSAERGWFDRFAEYAEHSQDVDICHHSAEHPEWVGLMHTIAYDHSVWGGPHSAFQRGIGLCMYWRLTGDPDAREAFMGLAEAIARTRMGQGTTYSRYWAGHVTTLIQAYDETWDERWAQECRWRVAELYTQIMDPRRGAYMDEHGHYNYRGMVPWMDAQVMRPLYLYYRLTGDVTAADALVALAEAIIEEAISPDEQRVMWGYSTNPRFSPTEGYNVLIAPAIAYAYELTENPEFLAVARLLYERAIAGRSIESPLNCSWNTPTLLYYLHKYREVEARLPWERPGRVLAP